MEKKLSRWEKKYEQYKDGKIDTLVLQKKEQLQTLKDILDGKTTKTDGTKINTKEEYRQYEVYIKNAEKEVGELEAIKANIGQIENILELRESLTQKKAEITEELNRRTELKNVSKENEALESELEDLNSERRIVEGLLKQPGLSDDKKEKINNRLAQVNEKINGNHEKYSKNFKTLENAKGYHSKLSYISTEELERKSIKYSHKISLCNMACSNLLKGKTFDSIDLKLEEVEGKRMSASGKNLDKLNNVKEVVGDNGRRKEEKEEVREGGSSKKEKDVLETSETALDLEEGDTQRTDEPKAVAKVSTFLQKHPRIAKMVNGVKGWFYKLRGKEEEKGAKGNVTEVKEEKATEKDEFSDFKKYLRDVAEKGMVEANKAKINEAKEKAAEAATKIDDKDMGEER